ncbi:MAG: histidine kinase [Chromatiaceae bacterium]|nr:histidine kinase [Chromatiaceae bacterium]
MRSIHARLLLAATLVLAAFLGLGALALDQAFRESMESAVQERLLQQVYALLGAADEDLQGRMRLPEALPNPRLTLPDSGLYAAVVGEQGKYRWRSGSLLGRELGLNRSLAPGDHRFERVLQGAEAFYLLNFGVAWQDDSGNELNYSFTIAENTAATERQVGAFRERLFYWIVGVSLLLLIAQGVVLGWGLKPLRQVAADLHRVESGDLDAITGSHPKELQGLIGNINMLIQSGRASRDRYRNSLGDLAHSLKTPLTLLRGAAEGGDTLELRQTVKQQVERMDEIVQYQLRRAAASSTMLPGTAVSLRLIVERLCATLAIIYREKRIEARITVEQSIRFYGEQADLMEVVGNLLDNAFKYGQHRVDITARPLALERSASMRGFRLVIEDDGPGIPVTKRSEVLNRGVRIDQRQPGQGIGLAVAKEIIALYRGSLEITASDLGGARIQVEFH